MKSNNTIPKAKSQQNLTRSYYRISDFLHNNAKGDLYKVTQAITWYMFKVRSHRLSRKALAKFAGCHVDTVSSINLRLEEEGLFGIGRQFKKPNVYVTEFLEELACIFGYSINYLLSSASLFKPYLNNLSNLYSKCENSDDIFLNSDQKRDEVLGNGKISSQQGTKCPPVLRPYTGMPDPDGRIFAYEQCDINVSQLFYKDEQRRLHEERRANQRKKLDEALSRDRFFKTKEPELNPIELMRRKFSLSF